jgi:hypothetical protein
MKLSAGRDGISQLFETKNKKLKNVAKSGRLLWASNFTTSNLLSRRIAVTTSETPTTSGSAQYKSAFKIRFLKQRS